MTAPERTPGSELVGEWFESHYRSLVRFLGRRLHTGHGEVEDLAQEAFMRMLRVDRTELVRNPQGYLHQVAANVLLEWRLRARQQRPHSSTAVEDLVVPESIEDAADREQRGHYMRLALRELPPLCQAVLMLRWQQDLTNEEIAARLGVTRRVVKRHLEIGYAQLRDRLSKILRHERSAGHGQP